MTTNDIALMVKMTCAGAGLIIGMAETSVPLLRTGELCAVVEPYCPPLPGFFLFYPSRRRLPLKVRALMDHVGDWRGGRT